VFASKAYNIGTAGLLPALNQCALQRFSPVSPVALAPAAFAEMMNLFRLAGDMAHILSIVVLVLRLRVTKNAIGISMKTQEMYLLVFLTRYLDLFTTYYSLYNTVMKMVYISSTALILYMVRKTEPFKTNYDTAQDSFLHWKFAVAPCMVLAVITNVWQGFDIIEVRRAGMLNTHRHTPTHTTPQTHTHTATPPRLVLVPRSSNFLHSPLSPLSPLSIICYISHITYHISHITHHTSQLFWVFSIFLEALAIVPQLIVLQRYREVENLTAHYVFLLGIYRALYIVNWVYRSYHEVYYKHNWVVYTCGFIQTCLYVDFFYYYFIRYVQCTV
jgi:hypothetical protein